MRMYDGSSIGCRAATSIADCVETFAPMLWQKKRKPANQHYPYVVKHVKRLAIAFHEPDKSSIHLAPVPPPNPENYEVEQ